MKRILIAAAMLSAFVGPTVHAASISAEPNGTAYSLYLNGGVENGAFNTFFIKVETVAPAAFTNLSDGFAAAGVPRPAGEPFTYYNRTFDVGGDPISDPSYMGWVVLGYKNVPTELSFVATPLGQKINTSSEPGGNLFLANVNLPNGLAAASVQLIEVGVQVGPILTATFGHLQNPEPAAAGMAGLSLVALVSTTRRRNDRFR